MKSLLHTFRQFLNRPVRSPRRRIRQQTVAIEFLEQRRLLTVVVQPNFGPTVTLWNQPGSSVPGQANNLSYSVGGNTYYGLNAPMTPTTNPYALQSPTVYLIYWGTDWTTGANNTPIASIATTDADVKTMISAQSGFLKTISQYGTNGQATFGGAWIDNTTDPKTGIAANNGVSPATTELTAIYNGQRNNNLTSVTGNGSLTLPTAATSSTNSPPVYVLIRNTTTSVTKDTYAGRNYLVTVPLKGSQNQTVPVDVNSIELEVGSVADSISEIFSHEFQERMVAGDNSQNDSVIFLPSTLQSTWWIQEGTTIQVADGEPDANYTFPLSGPGTSQVQAVWSMTDQAYLMADADTAHRYVLTPRWNVHTTPYTDSTGKLVNSAAFDANFVHDLSLTVKSGESLSIAYNAANNEDVFTWGTGQQQAFYAFDLGNVQINLAGSSNHTVTLGDLRGIGNVTITPTGIGTTTDVVNVSGQGAVNLNQMSSFTAVVDGASVQYVATQVTSATQNLVKLVAGSFSTVLPNVETFEPGYQLTHTSQLMLALTQDGVLHDASNVSTWSTLQTGVTEFGFGQFPQIKQGSTLNYNLLFTLDDTDLLTPYLNLTAQAKLGGVKDMQVTHWDGRTTLSYLTDSGYAYNYFGPTSDANTQGVHLIADTAFEWKGYQYESVLRGTEGDYYLGLNADGTLLQSDGTAGWHIEGAHIRSLKVAPWAGKNYAIILDGNGAIQTSADGLHWDNQGGGFNAFDIGNFHGLNVLFGLKTDGTLWRSVGTGWTQIASGVKSLQLGTWHGSEYAFYLDSTGSLHASTTGLSFYAEGHNIQSIALGKMNAVDTFYLLTFDGKLTAYSSIANGLGAPVIATDIQSFQLGHFAGQNTLFTLDGHGVLRSMVDGTNWLNQGTGITSFGLSLFSFVPYIANPSTLTNLQSATNDFLFALNANGTLQKSVGTGWSTVATNVASMQVARWLNANYVFYRTSGNVLYSSRDGVNFVNQGLNILSFAVLNLAGVDQLIAVATTGALQISSGSHWTTIATQVDSFAAGLIGTTNYLIYKTFGRQLYSSSNGSTFGLIDSSVDTFGIENFGGTGTLLDLTAAGAVKTSTGLSWSQLNTNIASLSIGWWNGENRFMTRDNNGIVIVYSAAAANGLSYSPARQVTFATLNGEHWLLSLGSDSTLQENNGSGWQLVTHGVVSIAVAHWASRDYAFYLDSSRTLATSQDGTTWTNQDTSVTTFGVGTQAGTTYLYDLNQGGILKQSIGGGWNQVMTGVTQFEMHTWASHEYAFYVTSTNLLKTSADGQTWSTQSTNTENIVVEELAGVDTLMALTSQSVLMSSIGSGWHNLKLSVQELFSGHFAGSNTVFYLDSTGELLSSSNGSTWNDQGGSYTSVVVATMAGHDYLFALGSNGSLIGSVGNGWYPIDSNVKQLFETSFVGMPLVEYVRFDRNSYSTTDGVHWNLV